MTTPGHASAFSEAEACLQSDSIDLTNSQYEHRCAGLKKIQKSEAIWNFASLLLGLCDAG
jgi:hypothetical protein